MLWSAELCGRREDSDYRDVSLVVQSPGRVAHQTERAVAPPPRRRLRLLDRRPERLPRPPRKLRVRAADRVQDVGVRAAELGRAQAGAQAPRQLVEEVEARRSVLDLDGVEVKLGGQPSHSVHRTATRAALRPPEGMHRDRQPALVVDRVHCRGGRHARPDAALEKQADDVAVAARNLLADDNIEAASRARILGRAQRALDGVVVCHPDHVEPCRPRAVDELMWLRPSVAERRVHVEVGPTPGRHGCTSYARRAYHRPTWTDRWGSERWRWRPWKG